ncbi:hypothetical protein CASFOL_036401 [Castilleja foliolosa]|uniref:Uncharacterized protein n=1 Tax=Castilleja foliolosa TaxID=1961234 RepID=A0ABD3BWM6_9LAMI
MSSIMGPLFRRYREQVLDSHAASEMRKCEEEFTHSQGIPPPIPIKTHTFKFKEGITSSIDKYFEEGPVYDYLKHPDPIIHHFFWREGIKLMTNIILGGQSDLFTTLFTTAEVCMGHFLNLFENSVPLPSSCVKSLLHGVWIDPLFRASLYEAMDSDCTFVTMFMAYSTQESVTDRTKRMEADIHFPNTLKKLKDPTSESTFLRLFLSILISYWTDDRMLRMLDLLKGKIIFTNRMDIRNRCRERIAKEKMVKLKLAGGEEMEPLKQLLDEKYGSCEDTDIERLALKMKPMVNNLLIFA